MGCFFFPCLISNQFILIRNKNNKLNSILLRLLQCKIILFYAKSITSICWFFFLNRLEHKYTCIHLDDMWCFKVPSPGGSSFNGCLGAVHYNLQRCSGWGDQVRNPEPLSYPPCVCTANTLIHSPTPSLSVALSISFNVSPIPTYMPFPPFCPDFQWVAVPQCLLLRQSQGPPHGLPYKYIASNPH